MAVQFGKRLGSGANSLLDKTNIYRFALAGLLLLPGVTFAGFVGVTLMTATQETVEVIPLPTADQESMQAYEAEDATLSPGFLIATKHPDFSGSGYVDYVGEGSVEWIVDGGEGGKFSLSFRYALKSGDRPLDIVVNDLVTSENLSLPATGAWNTWGSVATEVMLNPGANTVRVRTRGSSGPNIDSMGVSLLAAAQEPAQIIPILSAAQQSVQAYEAEDATLSSGFQIATKHGDFSGSGFVDYVGEGYVEWVVDAGQGGNFLLSFRYALKSGDRPMDVVVNDSVASANLSFPATGAWDAWGALAIEVTLNPGANIVRVRTRGSSGPNMDKVDASGVMSSTAQLIDNQDKTVTDETRGG